MSYLYSKTGSNFGLGATRGEVMAIPEPIPEPTRESYDPSTSYVQDPSPAEPALEISQSVPMAVEQYAYSLDRIVAGPTPTMEMPLSVADTPTALAARSLEATSSELQLQTAQRSLELAMQPMQSVDTRYADPSLFMDVPIRPTLTQAEMPVALPTQPAREMMTSNYETAPVRSTSLTPAAYEVAPEPTVLSAMQSRGGTVLTESPETLLSRLDMATTSTPVSQRGESLFDDPHPNLLENVVTQPVTGSKYDTLFTPMTETVPTEPSGACPPGWTENAPGSCSAPAGPPSAGGTTQADLQAAFAKLPIAMQQLSGLAAPVLVVQCSGDAQLQQLAQEFDVALSAFTKKYGKLSLATPMPDDVHNALVTFVKKWSKVSTCADLKAATADLITLCNNAVGGSAGSGGSALPLIAGAAALALLFFRR